MFIKIDKIKKLTFKIYYDKTSHKERGWRWHLVDNNGIIQLTSKCEWKERIREDALRTKAHLWFIADRMMMLPIPKIIKKAKVVYYNKEEDPKWQEKYGDYTETRGISGG